MKVSVLMTGVSICSAVFVTVRAIMEVLVLSWYHSHNPGSALTVLGVRQVRSICADCDGSCHPDLCNGLFQIHNLQPCASCISINALSNHSWFFVLICLMLCGWWLHHKSMDAVCNMWSAEGCYLTSTIQFLYACSIYFRLTDICIIWSCMHITSSTVCVTFTLTAEDILHAFQNWLAVVFPLNCALKFCIFVILSSHTCSSLIINYNTLLLMVLFSSVWVL